MPLTKATPPKDHPLWDEFAFYAKHNGISLEHRADWFDWWECFLAGAEAQKERMRGD